MIMKNKFLFFLLLSLILSACQREAYQPTATPGAPDPAVSTPLSAPSAMPGLAADTNPATPQPDWETLYTEANPVSDPEEIIAIFQDLYDRFMAQLDRPGWYRFNFMDIETIWIHVSNLESGRFDGVISLFTHEKYDGFIWPVTFLSLDGHYGRTVKNEAMDDFSFYALEAQPPGPVWENLDYYLACDNCIAPVNLQGLIEWVQDPDTKVQPKSLKKTEFDGWIVTFENQPVFTFRIRVTYLTNPTISSNGELTQTEEVITHFSLVNGGAISQTTNWYYQSGSALMHGTVPLNLHIKAWFEELPEQEQALYDACYRKLIEFEGSK